jgi:TrmH family RNA methyltransferase
MRKIQPITSAANPLIREVRRAISRGGPTADGCCVAEGFHLLEEALRSGCDVPSVLAAESVQSTVERHIGGLTQSRIVVLPDRLFQDIAATEASQGVIALVRPPQWSLDHLFRGRSLIVVLDGLQDPGNAGTIVRAAEAFGATGVMFLKGAVGAFHPKTLRASAGSLFRVPFVQSIEVPLALASLRQHRLDIYAAMPFTGSEHAARDLDLSRRCALVIGSEGRGISREFSASLRVAIPTAGVESLNAAVAASILLYEAHQQRMGSASSEAAPALKKAL